MSLWICLRRTTVHFQRGNEQRVTPARPSHLFSTTLVDGDNSGSTLSTKTSRRSTGISAYLSLFNGLFSHCVPDSYRHQKQQHRAETGGVHSSQIDLQKVEAPFSIMSHQIVLRRYLTTIHSPKKGWSNGTHTITWSNETHARIIPTNFVAERNDGSDPFLNSTTRIGNSPYSEEATPSMVWAGVLLGLVITCTLILCYLTIPAIVVWLHRMITTKIASSASRIQRRYETIEGWLISKVRKVKETAEIVRFRFIQVRLNIFHSASLSLDSSSFFCLKNYTARSSTLLDL